MSPSRARIERAVFILLVVALAISTYQTLFCVWMLAHPIYASPEWKTRLVVRMVTTLALGAAILLGARVQRGSTLR